MRVRSFHLADRHEHAPCTLPTARRAGYRYMHAPRVAVRACPGDGRNRVGWMERYGRETTRDVDLEPLLLAALRQRFSPTTVAEADLEYVPLRCLGSRHGRTAARLGRFTLFNGVWSDFGVRGLRWPMEGFCAAAQEAAANVSAGVADLGPALVVLSVEAPAVQLHWEPPSLNLMARTLSIPFQQELKALLPLFQVPWPPAAHWRHPFYNRSYPLRARPLLAALAANAYNPIRARLRAECSGDEHCAIVGGVAKSSVELWRNGTSALAVYERAVYCLQPWGDSATRKAFYDALSVGCINVIFSEAGWNASRAWFGDHLEFSVLVPLKHVAEGSVLPFLRAIPAWRVSQLHQAAMRARGRMQYVLEAGSQPPEGDAVSTIVRRAAEHLDALGRQRAEANEAVADEPAQETRTRRATNALRGLCRLARNRGQTDV